MKILLHYIIELANIKIFLYNNFLISISFS